jgi:hypothetical protein
MDEFVTDHWPGFVGMSLRLYSPHTRKWSIYWVNNQKGVLEPPVVGSFSNGVGVFEGHDELDGRPIAVRFTWSSITPTGVRWEQASPDEGHLGRTDHGDDARSSSAGATGASHGATVKVIELRNYLLQQGAPFIRYFEEHFLLSQRAEGMHPLGQFEVVGEPDRFVWIRGFDDMRTRLRGLTAFYSGPFWEARRSEANAMMPSITMHLFGRRRRGSDGGATLEDRASQPPGALPPETGLVVADFYRTEPAKLGRLVELFEQRVRPILLEQRHHVLGHFVAELQPNDYPRLPVIQDPTLLVVLSAYRDRERCAAMRHDWRSGGPVLQGGMQPLLTGEGTYRGRPPGR